MHKDTSLEGTHSSTEIILPTWQPMIETDLRDQVVEIINVIAERLKNPEHIIATTQRARQQSATFDFFPPSFANGFTSLALSFLYLAAAFPGMDWEKRAYNYLRLAAQATSEHRLIHPAVFGGSSGIAFASSLFYRFDERYHKTWKTFNQKAAAQILEHRWQRNPSGVTDREYDTITGAAGILGYLISTDSQDEIVHNAIERQLEYLIWLAGKNENSERRRWFIPPKFYPMDFYKDQYPDGYFNLGLAHGIPGPMAALSIAWMAGYRVDGQREAIKTFSDWITDHQVHDMWGVGWPMGIPLKLSYSADEWRKLPSARTAWCYGTPGVARALWLAGTALNDASLHQLALEGFEAVLKRPVERRYIDSPTLCHGIAGLLMICARFAHDTHSPLLHEHISLLTKQLLDTFNPNFPLGFRDEERPGVFVDDSGFLTGVSGILLVLLAITTNIEPLWNRALLIA